MYISFIRGAHFSFLSDVPAFFLLMRVLDLKLAVRRYIQSGHKCTAQIKRHNFFSRVHSQEKLCLFIVSPKASCDRIRIIKKSPNCFRQRSLHARGKRPWNIVKKEGVLNLIKENNKLLPWKNHKGWSFWFRRIQSSNFNAMNLSEWSGVKIY